jgi:hypothetical protein
MGLSKSEKQPFEKFYMWGDFSEVMCATETIDVLNAQTNVYAQDKDGNDVSATFIEQGTFIADDINKYLKFRVQGGSVSLSPYLITVQMVTGDGNRWETEGYMVVKNKPTSPLPP